MERIAMLIFKSLLSFIIAVGSYLASSIFLIITGLFPLPEASSTGVFNVDLNSYGVAIAMIVGFGTFFGMMYLLVILPDSKNK